jgi:hypothetical protein
MQLRKLPLVIAGLLAAGLPVQLFAQSRLISSQPDAANPMDAFNEGVRQGQARRQRDLDYQEQVKDIQRQQHLRALSAEFWASDDARKWQLLPQIAEIDPELAGQYQASIPPPQAAAQSIIYRCASANGEITYTMVPAPGCIVIAANSGQ